MKLEIKKIGDSYGVILPEEIISKFKLAEGDLIYLTEATEGYHISGLDPNFAANMEAFEETYHQYQNTFKELAK